VFCCGCSLLHRVVVVADELDVFFSGVEAEGSDIPARDDQEQLFEEEEVFTVVEEGKWSSPPACSLFVLYNCITN
jgi:hypothetical protein